MNVNMMNNMCFGSPVPTSLPIGCLHLGESVNYKHGGMIDPMLSKALGDITERRPNVVRQGLRLVEGGAVPATKGRPPTNELVVMPTKGVDNVPAMLQGGEIVIPKRYAPKVSMMLKRERIFLPGM